LRQPDAGQMRIIAFITEAHKGTRFWGPSAQAAPEYQVDQRINW
jgi:hypothetical protein